MVSNSSLPFPRVYRQLQTVRFSWFFKFQTPSTCWSLNYTFRRKTWCFFSFWLEISTSFFSLKIRTGGTKKQRPIPIPPWWGIADFRSFRRLSHRWFPVRCHLFDVPFRCCLFFCLNKETGQSLRVWRGGGVFFFLFDSAFISWIQPLKVFFLGGGSKWKGPCWFRSATEIYVVNQLQVECHTDHLE